MKFSTYQPQVNPNTTNAREVAVSNPLSYGGGGKGMQSMSGAFGQMAKVAQKIQDENDAADVAAARAEISQAINESLYSEDGIITTGKGKNYEGLTDRVKTSITDITNDIASKQNGRVSKVLREKYMPEDLTSYGKMAMQTENNERNKYLDTTYSSTLTNNTNDICAHFNDPDFVDRKLNETADLNGSRALRLGLGGQALVALNRSTKTEQIKSLVETCISNDDFESGNNYLEKYKKDLDPDAYNRLHKIMNERRKNNDEYVWAEEDGVKIYDPNTDTINEELAHQLAVERFTKRGSGADSFDTFMVKIGMQESGGNYDAVNSSSGAMGKYQIMPDNWPSWSQEAGLPAGAQMTPENQEKVARFKLKQYYDQYGPKGALVAWYAGPGNADRYTQGYSTDVWGRAWTAPQSDGPSIQGYVDEALAQNAGGESTGLNFDAQGAKQYEQALLAKARAIQRKHQAEISQVVDSYLERIESGNEDPNALILEIRNSGLKASVKKRLINDITGGSTGSSSGSSGRRGGSSGGNSGTKSSTWNTLRKIDIKLRRGEELTASDRVSLDNAIEELKANGAFNDDTDAGNDFYNLQLNPDKGGKYGFDKFTTNLDNGSSLSDEYLRMVEAGKANSLAALRMINAAYPSYD